MDCSAMELQPGGSWEAELAVCVRTSVSIIDVSVQVLVVICLGAELLTAVYRVQSTECKVHIRLKVLYYNRKKGNKQKQPALTYV